MVQLEEENKLLEKKAISGIMLTLLLTSMLTLVFNLSPSAAASLPVHSIDTGEDFATIQEAINAPETLNGHTIFVDAGTYYEHVVVGKSIQLIGEDSATTIIDGNGTGTVINVSANFVNISRFTIQNSGHDPMSWCCGIFIDYSDNNIIYGNTFRWNDFALFLQSSEGNNISQNFIVDNRFMTIFMYGSKNNVIASNEISRNEAGMQLHTSRGNKIIGNIITSSDWGIDLLYESNNIVVGNIIQNITTAIYIHASGNTIYHNSFINNTYQAWIVDPHLHPNTWDNGYPSGGNYWSNYSGTDFCSGTYQNETGSDGIGDTPCIIGENNQDRYPLMIPWPPHQIVQTSVQIAGKDYPITIEGNTTITNVVANPATLHFSTFGPDGTIGYMNVTLPAGLNKTAIKVFVDGVQLTYPPFPVITTNSTHYFIYFEFTQSNHTITIQYAPADIAVTNVMPNKHGHEKHYVYRTWTINVNVTILNNGTEPANITVSVYYSESGWHEIGTQTLTNLAPTAEITVTFSWNLARVNYCNHTIKANATLISDVDTNPANNEAYSWVKVKMAGDVDNDGDCDADDLFMGIGPAYGSIVPWPRYNQQCDFDGDGDVDADDVFLYASPNYGKKYSCQ